jgi:hypothetical protein
MTIHFKPTERKMSKEKLEFSEKIKRGFER